METLCRGYCHLIGSGVLSHKFVSSILYGLRLTTAGSNLLIGMTKMVGLRVAGWAGFFVHMYFFMEFHKVLDKYVGQPVKEQLSAGGVKNNLVELTDRLNQDVSEIPSFNNLIQNSSGLGGHFSERLKRIQGEIKALGLNLKAGQRQRGWFIISQQVYGYNKQINCFCLMKLLLNY